MAKFNFIQNKKWLRYGFILALCLNILLIVWLFHSRNMFHIDELFSFAHANSTQGAFLVKGIESNAPEWKVETYLYNRWFPGKFFHTWLTVQPGEAFKYGNVFENLADGVHPPLFYILLHTVCSFTPDVLSKWSGFALNIILWVILLWAIFRLAKLFFKDSFYAGCTVLFYAYSQVGLSTVLFIRGYLLQTLLAVGLVYNIARILQDNQADWKRCLKIGVLAVLGMLTHYNFVVFTALTGLITGVVLCWREQWQLCVRLGIVLSAGFVCFLLLFPPALDVMIASGRGREMMSRFQGGVGIFVHTDVFYRIMQQYLTWLWYGMERLWLLGYLVVVGVFVYKYKFTKGSRLIDWLLCVAIVMWIYVNFSMPEMYQFSIRYSMLVFPLLALGTIWYVVFCVSRLVRFPKNVFTKWVAVGIILVNSWAIWGFKSYNPFAFYNEFALNPTYFMGKKVLFTHGYDLNDKLAYAKQVFVVNEKYENHLKEGLEKADLLVYYRNRIYTGNVAGDSAEKDLIFRWDPTSQDRLQWVRRFHSPTYEYDVYLVKPKKD